MTEETNEHQVPMENLTTDTLNDKMDLDITETINFINNEELMDVDQENNMNVINQVNNENQNTESTDETLINKTITKRLTVVDSDSDDDINSKKSENDEITKEILNNDSNSCENFIKKTLENFSDSKSEENENDEHEIKRTKKKTTIIDSDDDSNSNFSNKSKEVLLNENETESVENKIAENKKRNRIRLYDSDSDEEITHNNENKQINTDEEISNDENETKKNSNENPILFSSDHKSKLSALCDSESSEDEEEISVRRHNFDEYHEPSQPVLKYKKSKIQEEKPKKMTGKDAMQQRREIQSESQRMVREERVSLPYHKSKSYTLKEFLEKRSKFTNIISLTKNKPTHLNMKMTPKQIEEMAKMLEQREKELDEFYKSDESEDETDNITNENRKEESTSTDKIEENIEAKNNENVNSVTPLEIGEINKGDNVEEQQLLLETNKDLNEDSGIKRNDELNKNINDVELNKNIADAELNKNISDADINKNINDADVELIKVVENVEDEILDDVNKKDTIKENMSCDNDTKSDNDSKSDKTNEMKSEQEKPKTSKILERLKKLNPLLALKTDFKPRISGNSKDIIILDDDVNKTRAINELKKRFIAQNSMKPIHTKDESHIMSVDSSVLKHEAAKVLIDRDDETRVVELKPGEKLKKLRYELELQMAKKRREQYEKMQKEIEAKKLEEQTYENEKEDCGMLDDEEEEEELTESETSDSDDEDMKLVEKPRKKSDFVDDEADVSEEEFDDSEDEEELNENEHNEVNNTKKEMKRILKPVDDSEDESEKNGSQESLNSTQSIQNDDNDNCDTLVSDDEDIPLYQKENLNKTPRHTIPESKSELDLTPTVCLTALQGMPSTSKRVLYESPSVSISLPLPQEPSPLRLNPGVKTKLFSSNDCENAYDELEELCSGKFTDAIKNNTKLTTQEENELLGLCSGKFDVDIPECSNTNEKNITSNIKLNAEEKELLGSGKFDLNVPDSTDDSQEKGLSFNISGDKIQNKENVDKELSEMSKNINIELENDSSNDSFLNKDKLEENYKSGIFDIDFNDNSQDMKLTFEDEPILKETVNNLDILKEKENNDNNSKQIKTKKDDTLRKLVILSSDEEVENNELLEKKKKKRKKKRKGLEFSDDDDSDVESITNEENELDINDGAVNYDSEENEIEYDENEEVVVKSAKNFFEAEAELSESEWGSADEDERGLDVLEMEDGDAEQFNEIKLQKELGKIHMRQVLDQDNREVRLIQELLLEDGELHGAKRERKFKWKNADSMTWNDDKPKDDDEEEIEEVENELEWRKMRHEREVFLEEQRKKAMKSANEIEILTSDSQILKLGHEILKKSQDSTSDSSTSVVPPKIESFSFLNKRGFRGSFLARSENTLSRLAEIAKVTEKDFYNSSGPKNSRNFVFTSVKSDEITKDVEDNEKKRKAPEGTPTVLKKMRISENSPMGARSNKKSKKNLFKPS